MDKQLFNKKLEPIGYLKRRWGGSVEDGHWEELILKLFPRTSICPPCNHFEFIWRQDKWTRKCLDCGERVKVSRVIDKSD